MRRRSACSYRPRIGAGQFDHRIELATGDEFERLAKRFNEMAAELAPRLPEDHFPAERLEAMTFPPDHFDLVVCNAVLHFAEDEDRFQAMLDGLWKALAPRGILGWFRRRR